MTRLVVAALAAGFAALLAAPTAQAQTAPPARPATQAEAARAQRQQQLTPEEADRDRQLQLMEARTGNTTFGMERSAVQGDKSGGGFRVRKFKELPGQEQKRGETRRVLLGARTSGKPLVHNKKKHKFLFF